MLRDSLYEIIHSRETFKGRLFDLVIQGFIILSIVTHSLETMNSLNHYSQVFHFVDRFFLVGFTFEYILRVYSAKKRFKFITSFYGGIDLCAILPGLIIFRDIDLRFLRIFRLIRIFRAFKLLRYSKALERLLEAFDSIKSEIIVFGCFSIILLYVSATGIYYFESVAQPDKFSSIPQSVWWSVCTLTTVGYGDVYPITPGGKIFTSFILFLGLSVIAVPSGLLASAFSKK